MRLHATRTGRRSWPATRMGGITSLREMRLHGCNSGRAVQALLLAFACDQGAMRLSDALSVRTSTKELRDSFRVRQFLMVAPAFLDPLAAHQPELKARKPPKKKPKVTSQPPLLSSSQGAKTIYYTSDAMDKVIHRAAPIVQRGYSAYTDVPPLPRLSASVGGIAAGCVVPQGERVRGCAPDPVCSVTSRTAAELPAPSPGGLPGLAHDLPSSHHARSGGARSGGAAWRAHRASGVGMGWAAGGGAGGVGVPQAGRRVLPPPLLLVLHLPEFEGDPCR